VNNYEAARKMAEFGRDSVGADTRGLFTPSPTAPLPPPPVNVDRVPDNLIAEVNAPGEDTDLMLGRAP